MRRLKRIPLVLASLFVIGGLWLGAKTLRTQRESEILWERAHTYVRSIQNQEHLTDAQVLLYAEHLYWTTYRDKPVEDWNP